VRPTVHPIVTPFRVLRVSGLLFLICLAVFIGSLFAGPGQVGVRTLLSALLSPGSGSFAGDAGAGQTILLSIRIPRLLFAGIVGAALSVSGVVFQALLRNPLADPYILGISGGAAVGAIAGILLGAAAIPFGVPGLAFVGALTTLLAVFAVAGAGRDLRSHTLLLAGVIVNAFFNAAIMFLLAVSSSGDLHSIMFWLMGDLSLARGRDILSVGAALVVGFSVIGLYARPLNLIVTGEETARTLGVDPATAKRILLVTTSLMTGLAVSVSGTIGFVGLMVPHLMRMALGPDHRLLLPASLFFGAAFLILADTLARTLLAPMELPVGVVTALCGAPYFIYLLRRMND